MNCYDPDEQCFDLKDKIIAIDWGKNGDAAVYVEAKKNSDGTVTVTEVREISTTINKQDIIIKAMEEASKVLGADHAYFGEEGEEEVERQLKKMGYSLEDFKEENK